MIMDLVGELLDFGSSLRVSCNLSCAVGAIGERLCLRELAIDEIHCVRNRGG